MAAHEKLSKVQFFHGTRHTLKRGQVMEGGKFASNQGYGQPGEHVYFSSDINVATDFAHAGYGPKPNYDAPPRVYQVEPVGQHELDPDEEPEAMSYRAKQARVIRQMR
jgi:Rifampin ADP-ribosyl transferase